MDELPLPLEDYQRYGRQMILDGIGLPGQIKLQQASVAVVGAGGLGCPALQYLAAAGVGTLGIIDHDVVELSNLQRQILHTTERIGMPKALSAAQAIKQINERTKVVCHTCSITSENAHVLLEPFDIILDCTDNAPTRYLLSDTAVALKRPLVSGAAQKFDGQLCTYNLGEDGPCYRCLFPKPPSPEMAGSCRELGILGAVTGIIGNLQALEAVKIIMGLHVEKPSLLVFSALATTPFRSFKLRARRETCPACGTEGKKEGSIQQTDYVAFCGGPRPDWVARGLQEGDSDRRIKPMALKTLMDSDPTVKIVDVRPRTEFSICHLPNSLNIPIQELVADPEACLQDGRDVTETYVVCRLGNDSQIAVDAIRSIGLHTGIVKDLIGGLRAWTRDVDPHFPVY